MRAILLPVLIAASTVLAGCGGGSGSTGNATLSVAATAVPPAEIVEVARPILEKAGVGLQVRVFNDSVQPNDQVAQKHIDVNYSQTEPYLAAYNKGRGTSL